MGWEKRATIYGNIINVRKLTDKEVANRKLHRQKSKDGYDATDIIYEDKNGDTWIGSGTGKGVLNPFP